MSSNEIQTSDVNGSRLAEQGPSSGRCSRQGNIGRHHANPVISKRRKWTSQENKIVMECYLLSEPKIRGYRKRMLSLWQQKGMLWVSEQRLVDQANTIRRNSWRTELEIEELERKVTGSDSVIGAETRSSEALPDQVGEDRKNVLLEMGAEEQADSLDEEEVAIVMEIAEVIEKGRKDKLPALRNVPKKKLLQLKECLDSGFVPSWLTRGRTSLLQKDKNKGNVASNYRPITCLPLMWKLLTGVIADQIYAHLDQEKLLPEEQKGCRKGSRGTNDLLYIDRAVIKEVKSRNKNLAMAWIDYKKVYDMVPHSWIIECLDLFGVAENIKSLLVNSMEKWKLMLCSGNSELGEVEIKRGIFQGDSLSPLVFVLALIPLSLTLRKAKAAYEFSENKEKINHLLFMDDLKLYSRSEKGLDSLVQTVRVFSEDIGMEFGIEKCAMLVMEKGKIVKSVGIELPDGKVIKSLQEGESYKYLGILEADKFLEERMKLNVSKEYIRRLRKVLKSKLNGGNLVHGVNASAVSLLRYSAAFFS